ncbi:aminoglycoside phosphotransferase (APT) family kinase protein [Neobacillus niacini]|uniref:phosphotransferase family protein n=1 Tax=Neobacillus niacini TaxID=86668 RepID=UPI0028592D64|nr:phosphotransferase family protein [Neobacillus niacini]MDR7075714.1 aminoglycoside phosphotransferase (APT) family kinase protein [Neobacillus niacini]
MKTANQSIDSEHINWGLLETLIRETNPGIPNEAMKVRKFSEGYSNHTYLLTFGKWEAVLRRPPFGEIPAKAHDIKREYKILSRLHGVYPLAPKPYLYSDDPAIMGKHFYLMEKKQGVVINDALPETYGSSDLVGPAISKSIINSLVELQKVDYKKANLMDIGKPEGFLERQVHGWIKRYSVSKTHDIAEVAELEAWLVKQIPKTVDTTIVHNDFKLNNLVLDPHDPGEVNGVLDWEMATIGDPMSDIGAVLAYWGEAGDPDMGISLVTNQKGFFSRREMAELYAKVSGRDISHIDYYTAFGFYKLAVILQQLYYRWKKGAADDERFAKLHIPIANLFDLANVTRTNKIL